MKNIYLAARKYRNHRAHMYCNMNKQCREGTDKCNDYEQTLLQLANEISDKY